MVDVTAERIVRAMHAQLRNYDYLLPGDFVPEPPLRKRWFRWRPAFAVTQELLVWAGEIARARSLMDLKQAADLIAATDAPPPVNQAHNPVGDKMMSTDTELGPCPFCGKPPVRVSIGTASCDGMVDGKEVHNTIGMRPECWNTRASGLAGVVGERDDDLRFVWKWIERAIFDDAIGAKEALSTLAHYPGAPWKRGRWDVDHKPYAAKFYAQFPKANALSPHSEGER